MASDAKKTKARIALKMRRDLLETAYAQKERALLIQITSLRQERARAMKALDKEERQLDRDVDLWIEYDFASKSGLETQVYGAADDSYDPYLLTNTQLYTSTTTAKSSNNNASSSSNSNKQARAKRTRRPKDAQSGGEEDSDSSARVATSRDVEYGAIIAGSDVASVEEAEAVGHSDDADDDAGSSTSAERKSTSTERKSLTAQLTAATAAAVTPSLQRARSAGNQPKKAAGAVRFLSCAVVGNRYLAISDGKTRFEAGTALLQNPMEEDAASKKKLLVVYDTPADARDHRFDSQCPLFKTPRAVLKVKCHGHATRCGTGWIYETIVPVKLHSWSS